MSVNATASLEERIALLEAQLQGSVNAPILDRDHKHLDTSWLIITSTIVFLMQLGFAMLEAGMCRENNVRRPLSANAPSAAD